MINEKDRLLNNTYEGTYNPIVRHFRHVLYWPVQLMPPHQKNGYQQLLCDLFAQLSEQSPWYLLSDRFTADWLTFDERHYKEFVTFSPQVQRFIYGEGRSRFSHGDGDIVGEAALKIFRRDDISALRIQLYPDSTPITLNVQRLELCFFDDIHVAFLRVESFVDGLAFSTVNDLLYRFGRAYPTAWDERGHGRHNTFKTEWLNQDGQVIIGSDSTQPDKFIQHVRNYRSAAVTQHWEFLLRPMVLDTSDQHGVLRYRQIESHRMPVMAYLALDNPRQLSQEQWMRLGLVAHLHPDENLPPHDPVLREFEKKYCYDRFWVNDDSNMNSRFLCSGRAFIVVGDAKSEYFQDRTHGVLAQFRHQYALLFLIVHFHRTSLLVFSERMVDAVHDLNIRSAKSIIQFRRRAYAGFEAFLRFTHRYWFRELSEREHIQDLYQLMSKQLKNEVLYSEVKDGLLSMTQYLDSNAQRQQSTTVVRLTVVTVFSMLCTIVSGLLGMNLIDEANAPLPEKVTYFLATLLITALFVLFALIKSKSLSDVMDVLSDDQKPLLTKFKLLGQAWRR